jgi:hypothetical protein
MAFSGIERSNPEISKIEGFEFTDKFPATVNFEGNTYTFGNPLPEHGVAAYSRIVKADFPMRIELLIIDQAGVVKKRLLQDDESLFNKSKEE